MYMLEHTIQSFIVYALQNQTDGEPQLNESRLHLELDGALLHLTLKPHSNLIKGYKKIDWSEIST